MTEPALAAAAGERPFSARLFLNRAVGFWTGPNSRNAWLWTGGALALVFANLAVNVGINRWNKWFFDALERKDGSTLWTAVLQGPQDVPLDMVERLFWALAHTAEPCHCPSVCPQ